MAHGSLTGYMHTGFDHKMDFEQLARYFARGYGAYIYARDEPWDFEITDEFWEPRGTYFKEKIESSTKILEAFTNGDEEYLKQMFDKEIEKCKKDCEQSYKEAREQVKLAEKWLDCAERLNASVSGYGEYVARLKEDIRNALAESKREVKYYEERYHEKENKDYNTWKKELQAECIKDLEYCRKELKEEKNRQDARKKWHLGLLELIADAQKAVESH